MIQLDHLTKEFRTPKKHEGLGGAFKTLFSREYTVKRAVDDLSLTIAAGESIGFIGVNGAGKSTTIKMMTGILHPTSGQCRVFGVEAHKNRQKNAQNIGVVFGQRTQLWWDLPVSESLGILRRLYQVPKARFDENLAWFKKILELDEFYLTPVRNLSLGQRMRADFAASMLHDPKILFLDEPTIGLDLVVKERLREAIKDVNKNRGTTIFLTTHDLGDIEQICGRIIVIDDGKRAFDGSQDDLRARYGRIRRITFDLGKPGGAPLEGLPEGVTAEESPDRLILRFPREGIRSGDLIARVVQEREVKDLAIEDPDIADIVKEIYQRS